MRLMKLLMKITLMSVMIMQNWGITKPTPFADLLIYLNLIALSQNH